MKEYERPSIQGLVLVWVLVTGIVVAGTSPGLEAATVDQNQVVPRLPDGDATVAVGGELKVWHKVTLTMDAVFAHEHDQSPNPFRDYRMSATFQHQSGSHTYDVPGFFAADGQAGETSATAGTQWRVHFVPNKTGVWNVTFHFVSGDDVALDVTEAGLAKAPYDGVKMRLNVTASDKTGKDLRSKGRLEYVGERYLKFAGSGEYFLKAGADAPETFLGYADFDGTEERKRRVPLKTWAPHLADWREGDPTWKNGKGKGMIGAINYLASKGCNVFSFLTYNAGGDGDNVWPFVSRDDKFHYDCSKLDQWGVVFDHATTQGHYLHFKLQETENDDHKRGRNGAAGVPESLDGGDLGPERQLYCRELVARFGHALALNWNLGEENTQTTEQQRAMAEYLREVDPYNHLIVVHTFPNEQDKVYRPLMGGYSALSGMSLQNSHIRDTHRQVVKWVTAEQGDRPWVIAFDESGSAAHGQVPDLGYEGFAGIDSEGEKIYTQHEVRRQTLWGTLMGGGAGVEYYFGYRVPQNDLICEDWRSRDQSWDYCRHALAFFRQIPFSAMSPADSLVGNDKNDNSIYCFAQPGVAYVVYLPYGGAAQLDLSRSSGQFEVVWYNPRSGGPFVKGTKTSVKAGRPVSIGMPPRDREEDWVALIRSAGQ